jgi:hypothetical protein
MGSGEFDGGGSVQWTIEHGDGEHGKGDKKGAKGRDKHPEKGTGGKFVVKLNGVEQFTADTDSSVIRVEWDGPGVPARATTAAATATKSKTGRASSAKKASRAKKSSKRRTASR